jgi:presenilin-like A22 family membrane protease
MPPDIERHPGRADRARFSSYWVMGSYAILVFLAILAIRTYASNSIMTPSSVPDGIVTWQLFVFIAAVLLLAGFVIRRINVRIFYELLLGVTLFLGVWVFMWFILPWEIALLIAAGLTILQARVRKVMVHDAFILIGAAGIAVHFAFLFPLGKLALILVAFALYDMLAGCPEGIAARLAGTFIHRGVVPGLIVPSRRAQAAGEIAAVVKDPDAAFLGAGDLILPLILVARAAAYGIAAAVAVSAGLILGAFWLVRRGPSKPRPALIPLLIGAGLPFFMLYVFRII